MVEKMGHKKMMQSARMEWINEGKPHSSVHEDSLFDEPALPLNEGNEGEKTAPRVAPIFDKAALTRSKTPNLDIDEDIDLYDATPRPVRQRPEADISQANSSFNGGAISIFGPAKSGPVADDDFPEDDLNALLAEDEEMQASAKPSQPSTSTIQKTTIREEDLDYEMELMADMGW
jgi:replication fork protection complex subunit Csm3/Swi3